MFIFGIIIVTIIGIIMVSNPYFVYEIIEEWKNTDGKGPSKAYILNVRLGGIIFLIVGIGCGLIGFLAS